jgi:hypothetical protein
MIADLKANAARRGARKAETSREHGPGSSSIGLEDQRAECSDQRVVSGDLQFGFEP